MSSSELIRSLPFLTASVPGCGGVLKYSPEDFIVEEIPLYHPAGSGEHLYIWIEKQNISTEGALRHLARKLDIPLKFTGHAGKKDTDSISRQWLSFHTPAHPQPNTLESSSIRILEMTRHSNKLRRGHLRGNAFNITVRNIDPEAQLEPLFSHLLAEGFPNYFGAQRMGRDDANVHQGRAFVRNTEERPGKMNKGGLERTRFVTNAYQSALFNEITALRLQNMGTLGKFLPGDIAVLHHNGASFPVAPEELDEIQARANLWELSPSAPLFGYKVSLCQEYPGRWESAILSREGLSLSDFRLGSKSVSPKGERRSVRARPHELSWDILPNQGNYHLRLQVTLDKGVFATSLLREVMKNEGPSPF